MTWSSTSTQKSVQPHASNNSKPSRLVNHADQSRSALDAFCCRHTKGPMLYDDHTTGQPNRSAALLTRRSNRHATISLPLLVARVPDHPIRPNISIPHRSLKDLDHSDPSCRRDDDLPLRHSLDLRSMDKITAEYCICPYESSCGQHLGNHTFQPADFTFSYVILCTALISNPDLPSSSPSSISLQAPLLGNRC